MSEDQDVVGKIGLVTGHIGPNRTGEVLLPFGSGTAAYVAHPANGTDDIPINTQVVVVDYVRPLTVFVSAV